MSSPKPDLINLARTIAHAHCKTRSVSCRLHDEQGCFSQTYIVELENQSPVIVQFRDTPLDLSYYVLARRTSFLHPEYMHLSPERVCREIGNPGSSYREEEHR
jgi:hypothetical protein